MTGNDRLSQVARVVLRVFLVGNIVCGIGFAAAIALSFPLADALAARLTTKYGAGANVTDILLAARLLFVAGIVAAAALRRVFVALLAILATVSAGDPFTLANAARLRSIGWAFLILQLLDLMLGGFTAWFHALHVEFVPWTPAFGGWLAVLLAFVLANVFRRGAAMRDDMAMTI